MKVGNFFQIIEVSKQKLHFTCISYVKPIQYIRLKSENFYKDWLDHVNVNKDFLTLQNMR